MKLNDHLMAVESSSKNFDRTIARANVLTEATFMQLDISKDEAKLQSIQFFMTENEENDLMMRVIQESAEKVSDILDKTREAYHAYNKDIDNTINGKILTPQTNALFKKIEERMSKNSKLKNRTVDVHDSKKEIDVILSGITDIDKLIVKIKSSSDPKSLEQELDHIHFQCQKDRKKVGNISMTANQIIDSLKVPSKIGKDILTYEKDIKKLSESEQEGDQEKARIMLKGHLALVKMAKEVRSVELHGSLECLRKLRSIFSGEKEEVKQESVVTEAVVNDRKVAKVSNDISSSIVTIKTYIKVAKTIMRNPQLKGTTPAELKGFIKECEAVIKELRSNRQHLREAVRKAKLGDANLKDKIFGDGEVRSVLTAISGTMRSVASLRRKMNKISRQNRKIIRSVKTIEAVKPKNTVIESAEDEEYLKQAVADLFMP